MWFVNQSRFHNHYVTITRTRHLCSGVALQSINLIQYMHLEAFCKVLLIKAAIRRFH